MFQSSPVPKDGCNRPTRIHGDSRLPVSILTRPEGRVQRRPSSAEREAFQVSILTRPEGRVQHFLKNFSDGGYSFQSSPVPKDGCNTCLRNAVGSLCTVSILTRPEGRVQRPVGYGVLGPEYVSILTRPEGRVQRHTSASKILAYVVSILTRPEGRVQQLPSKRGP